MPIFQGRTSLLATTMITWICKLFQVSHQQKKRISWLALQGIGASFTEKHCTHALTHTNDSLDHSRERRSSELSEINPAEAFGKRASASNKPWLILVICTFRGMEISQNPRLNLPSQSQIRLADGAPQAVTLRRPNEIYMIRNMEIIMKLKIIMAWA